MEGAEKQVKAHPGFRLPWYVRFAHAVGLRGWAERKAEKHFQNYSKLIAYKVSQFSQALDKIGKVEELHNSYSATKTELEKEAEGFSAKTRDSALTYDELEEMHHRAAEKFGVLQKNAQKLVQLGNTLSSVKVYLQEEHERINSLHLIASNYALSQMEASNKLRAQVEELDGMTADFEAKEISQSALEEELSELSKKVERMKDLLKRREPASPTGATSPVSASPSGSSGRGGATREKDADLRDRYGRFEHLEL
ncbi:hypothetical protein HY095_00225 [Candidatus Micrarchaeota archaeon]|nr:hypothetical protein [Candidatus Micrarchaeota archaeon]